MNYYIYITCINLCLPGFPFNNRNIWLYFNIDFNIQPSHILSKRISVPFYMHTHTHMHTHSFISHQRQGNFMEALFTHVPSTSLARPDWALCVCIPGKQPWLTSSVVAMLPGRATMDNCCPLESLPTFCNIDFSSFWQVRPGSPVFSPFRVTPRCVRRTCLNTVSSQSSAQGRSSRSVGSS